MKRAGGIGSEPGQGRSTKRGKCMFVHAYMWAGGGDQEGTPDSLYSYVVGLQRRLRDCHPFETVGPWQRADRGGLGETVGRLFVVLFECRPKTILYHVEDSSAIVIVVAVIYNLQRGGERER